MPTYALEIQAQFENVESMVPKSDVVWKFDIENDSSETREGITVDPAEELELSGSRGSANFVMKWNKSDTHQAYIKILDVKKALGEKKKGKKAAGDAVVDGSYRSKSEEWVPIVCMECRGLRPTSANIGDDFIITTSGGTVFNECEFASDREGLEWADYDEENDDSVMVTKLQARVVEVP